MARLKRKAVSVPIPGKPDERADCVHWPWLQLLRSYVQQQPPEQLQAEMGPGAADIAEIAPEIRDKLTDLEPPPSLEPEQARFRLFDSITTFLKKVSGHPQYHWFQVKVIATTRDPLICCNLAR